MTKKICVFTQTYGNNREELFYYHNYDHLDIYFRNSFDINFYAFHNCDENYKNKILQNSYFNQINNLSIVDYYGIEYTQSWKLTMQKFAELGVEYVIFLQDDCFSISTKEEMDDLINYIKNENFNLLSIEQNSNKFKLDNCKITYSNFIKVYNTTSNDYVGISYYFDDGPFVGNVSYIEQKIYDEIYYNMGLIWSGELYLHKKIELSPVERFVTSSPSHRRFNFVGKNIAFKDEEIQNLKSNLNL